MLYNVFDAFVSLGGPKINAAEIIKGIGMDIDVGVQNPSEKILVKILFHKLSQLMQCYFIFMALILVNDNNPD